MTYQLPKGSYFQAQVSNNKITVSLFFGPEALPPEEGMQEEFDKYGKDVEFSRVTINHPKECEIPMFYRMADYLSEYILWIAIYEHTYGESHELTLPQTFPTTALDYEAYEVEHPNWIRGTK